MIDFSQLKENEYGEASRKVIAGWKERAIELAEQENFRGHPVTRKLAQEAKQCIEAIENSLKNDETITELERKALFKEKKVHQFYYSLFTKDGSSELEQIAQLVEQELV